MRTKYLKITAFVFFTIIIQLCNISKAISQKSTNSDFGGQTVGSKLVETPYSNGNPQITNEEILEKWVKETYGKDYLIGSYKWGNCLFQKHPSYLDERYSSCIKEVIIVPPSSKNIFTASNSDEVLFFYENFKDPIDITKFLKRSVDVADNEALALLISLYPNVSDISYIKHQYVLKAPTIRTYSLRLNNYKGLLTKEEEIHTASLLVKTLLELDWYRTNYGNSTQFDNDIYCSIYNRLSIEDLKKLISYYPNALNRNDAINQLISMTKSIRILTSLLNEYGNFFKPQIEKQGVQLVLNDYTNFTEFSKSFSDAEGLHKLNSGLYVGGWDYTNNYPSGNGVLCESGSDYCIGTFVDGKLTGNNCKVLWGDELSYEGQAADGAPNGQGTGKGTQLDKRYPLNENGVSYTGNWVDGWPSGTGKYATTNTWIEGTFKSGYTNGYATMRSSDGIRISGNFSMGNPDGNMKIEKWSLLGLLSTSATINATSWDELNNGARMVVSGYNSQIRELFSSSNNSSSSGSSGSNSDSNDISSSSSSSSSLSSGNNTTVTVLIKLMKTPGCSDTNYDSYSLRIRTRPADKEKYIVLSKKSGSYWYNGCDFSNPLSWSKDLSFFKVLKRYYSEEIDSNASIKEVIYDDGNSETTIK